MLWHRAMAASRGPSAAAAKPLRGVHVPLSPSAGPVLPSRVYLNPFPRAPDTVCSSVAHGGSGQQPGVPALASAWSAGPPSVGWTARRDAMLAEPPPGREPSCILAGVSMAGPWRASLAWRAPLLVLPPGATLRTTWSVLFDGRLVPNGPIAPVFRPPVVVFCDERRSSIVVPACSSQPHGSERRPGG